MLDLEWVVSARPFASLTESFLEDRLGTIEGEIVFELLPGEGDFMITVEGRYLTGAPHTGIFLNQRALSLLTEMFAWRGAS